MSQESLNISGRYCKCFRNTCILTRQHNTQKSLQKKSEQLEHPVVKESIIINTRPIQNNENVGPAIYMSRAKLRSYPQANVSHILNFKKEKIYLGREIVIDGPKYSSLRTFGEKITKSYLDEYF